MNLVKLLYKNIQFVYIKGLLLQKKVYNKIRKFGGGIQMGFFLLKMSVCGIKNIDKEIEINFYNSTLNKNFDTSNSHVKAIYGANGAGKTGIMYAVDIYQNLVLSPKYLTVCNANGSLNCLINQNTKELKINMVFLYKYNNGKKVFSHLIKIKKIDSEFKIAEEKLSELSGVNLNNVQKYSTVFHSVEGNLVELHKKCKHFNEWEKSTMNLLSSQSFLCAAILPHVSNKNLDAVGGDIDLLIASVCLLGFASSLTIVLQNSDKFIDYSDVLEQFNELVFSHMPKGDDGTPLNVLSDKSISYLETQKVLKSKFKEHENYIYNLSLFIKVFNDELENIEIKKDENGDYYECENIMVYKNKRISEKFESTGIKKLINLYSALCDLNIGKIVFIDEFDANIHDVLLEKLIQYIMQYAKGQFIFTTHNLGPMDVLQSAKNSIDFLSSDSRIVSWTKNGNYTAASQYKKGLIKYSPFNIEPFSFLGVFGDSQK